MGRLQSTKPFGSVQDGYGFTSHRRFRHEVTPHRIRTEDGAGDASAWTTLTPAGV